MGRCFKDSPLYRSYLAPEITVIAWGYKSRERVESTVRPGERQHLGESRTLRQNRETEKHGKIIFLKQRCMVIQVFQKWIYQEQKVLHLADGTWKL